MKLGMILAAAAACAFAVPASAQEASSATVTLYRAAPGQQVALLKWLAQQDAVSAAAGLPKNQLYVHTDGDSWDYMTIAPSTTSAQDDAYDAAAKKMGVTTGPRVGIELRRYIAYHTDTQARGPTSAADYLAAIGEK